MASHDHDHSHDHHGHYHDHEALPPRALRRLPVLGDERPLTLVEAAHLAYGGRGASAAGIGELVLVRDAAGAEQAAVVLFVEGDELDVILDDRTLAHTPRECCRPLAPPHPLALTSLRADALRFSRIDELDRVRFRVGSRVEHGMLAEKCRHGAIVMRDDGSLQGVSFRDLNPGE